MVGKIGHQFTETALMTVEIHKGFKSVFGAWTACGKTAWLDILYNYSWNKVTCKACLKNKGKSKLKLLNKAFCY